MVDRQYKLKNSMIAQHASIQRENSQPSQASSTSRTTNVETLGSKAHVSLPSFFRFPIASEGPILVHPYLHLHVDA